MKPKVDCAVWDEQIGGGEQGAPQQQLKKKYTHRERDAHLRLQIHTKHILKSPNVFNAYDFDKSNLHIDANVRFWKWNEMKRNEMKLYVCVSVREWASDRDTYQYLHTANETEKIPLQATWTVHMN